MEPVSQGRSSRGLSPGSNSQLAPALAALWIPATLGTSPSAGKCRDDRRIWVECFHLDRKGSRRPRFKSNGKHGRSTTRRLSTIPAHEARDDELNFPLLSSFEKNRRTPSLRVRLDPGCTAAILFAPTHAAGHRQRGRLARTIASYPGLPCAGGARVDAAAASGRHPAAAYRAPTRRVRRCKTAVR